jgi:hypothetical protein
LVRQGGSARLGRLVFGGVGPRKNTCEAIPSFPCRIQFQKFLFSSGTFWSIQNQLVKIQVQPSAKLESDLPDCACVLKTQGAMQLDAGGVLRINRAD